MKSKKMRINKGIVLLFLLVVGVVIFCIIDEAKYNSRKSAAEERARTFITNIAGVFSYPKDMPDVEAIELERNADKYLKYLDAGIEKVRPLIYNSKALEDELKNTGARFMTNYLVEDLKAETVTLEPQITKIIIKKEVAIVTGNITSKTTFSKGKVKDKTMQFRLQLEYCNDNWVVTDFSLDQD